MTGVVSRLAPALRFPEVMPLVFTPELPEEGGHVRSIWKLAGYPTLAELRGAGAPRRSPSVLRSSSTSGQWIPKPPPAICQLFRCSGVA